MGSSLKERRESILRVLHAIVLCAIVVSLLGASLSLIQTSKTIASAGTVRGVGVGIYWNLACTNRTSSIAWGSLDPGSNKTLSVYVRNEGNSAATLSKTQQNWSPAVASSYITVNWNYAGQTLSVNQTIQVKFTLVVSPSISGITNFSFDITITASG